MNHAMGSDQWFWLSVFIIVPVLSIYALATKNRVHKLWLSRFLAVLLVGFVAGSAIYLDVQSVITKEAGIILILAAWLWLQSKPKVN